MHITLDAEARDAAGAHVASLRTCLAALEVEGARAYAVGVECGARLSAGGRLLAAGNGGSAAHAQHLTAELVGRYQAERRPLSAIALNADTSTTSAITNDYGPSEVFRRQVFAHGRVGDVLVLFSTSGRSSNVLAAALEGVDDGLHVVSFTGDVPNPLASASHVALTVESRVTAVVQEGHQILLHLFCAGVEATLLRPHRLEVPT